MSPDGHPMSFPVNSPIAIARPTCGRETDLDARSVIWTCGRETDLDGSRLATQRLPGRFAADDGAGASLCSPHHAARPAAPLLPRARPPASLRHGHAQRGHGRDHTQGSTAAGASTPRPSTRVAPPSRARPVLVTAHLDRASLLTATGPRSEHEALASSEEQQGQRPAFGGT